MDENIKENKWWKIIAILVIGILLGIIVGVKFISALSWFLNKEATCNMFNITGISCETFWCNEVQGGNYSTQNETCIVREIINGTIIYNVSNNSTGNYTFYYGLNETERKAELEKYLGTNLSTGTFKDQILNESKNYTDTQNKELTMNMSAEINGLDVDEATTKTKQKTPAGVVVLLGVLALIILLLGVMLISNRRATHFDENTDTRQPRKIQMVNELSKDEKIRHLEKELKRQNKEYKKSEVGPVKDTSSKKQEITLDEDLDEDEPLMEED